MSSIDDAMFGTSTEVPAFLEDINYEIECRKDIRDMVKLNGDYFRQLYNSNLIDQLVYNQHRSVSQDMNCAYENTVLEFNRHIL